MFMGQVKESKRPKLQKRDDLESKAQGHDKFKIALRPHNMEQKHRNKYK